MEAKLYGQNKGGMSINGIIKDYYAYAGEKISAGDLVEYVNGVAGKKDYGESVDTQLSTETYTGYKISAVALDENRVFIAHSYEGGAILLYGMVVTIDGSTITYGTDTVLNNTGSSAETISTVLLPNGNVFIAHRGGANSSLYGMVCTISGDVITVVTDTQLSSDAYTGYAISTCLLPNGNVFIAHSYGSNYYLRGIVVSINGTTITKGTDTALVSSNYAGYTISTCLLPNGNVFIAHSYSSNYHLYGIVCSISGTTITAGSDTAITASERTGYRISTCLLPNGNIFIAHSYTTNNRLLGIVVKIDGTTITKGTSTSLLTQNDTGNSISTCLLPNGNVFVIHGSGSGYFLYGMIVSIDDTAITAGTDTALVSSTHAGSAISSLLLLNGTIFIAHSHTQNTYYLNAQIWGIDYENNVPTNHIIATEYETQIRKVTTGQFDGVAKTSGEGSPEFVEGEVKKTGNVFPTSGWNEEVQKTKYSSNGWIIEANSAEYSIDRVSDNNESTNWYSLSGETHWIKMTCPEPQKITKMTYNISMNAYNLKKIAIQGSKDDDVWVDLGTPSTSTENLTEITLSNTDFYKYYRFYADFSSNSIITMYEWQTSEYIELGLVPSTEHKDIVSIWTKE